ncbi:MAG TPA: N-formylglutamate amidohydrolase [Sandaracinaceae bacterium]
MTVALSSPGKSSPLFELELDDLDQPLLAVAVHHGHALRPEVEALVAVDDARRRHEEDPLSGEWTTVAKNRLVALRSRFEVDLNRPPELAVYLEPEECWGLQPWKERPAPDVITRSLEEHARFYRSAREAIELLLSRNPRVLVLDLHSYNHRRGGPDAPPDDPSKNPDLNVGTGTMDRARWAPVVDAFIAGARAAGADGPIDVRENVRFFGGHFPAWVHRTFPDRACALALEVKKTFMDEWTGTVDLARLAGWREILRAGTAAALGALEAL